MLKRNKHTKTEKIASAVLSVILAMGAGCSAYGAEIDASIETEVDLYSDDIAGTAELASPPSPPGNNYTPSWSGANEITAATTATSPVYTSTEADQNIALNICKMNKRQKRYAVYCELTQEMQECIPAENDIEAEIEADYLSSLIDAFLETCTEEQQNVFVRRYWYFDSVAEIAKMYGFSQSKVKTMLFRMRENLKTLLEKEGYDI